MGRRAQFSFMLPDGKTRVGYGFKFRGNIYRVQFLHPTEDGKYVEFSTGCTTENDAHIEAAKIVLRTYQPTVPVNPKTTDWIRRSANSPAHPACARIACGTTKRSSAFCEA